MRTMARIFALTVAAVALLWGTAFAKTNWDLYSFVGITHPIGVHLKEFTDEVRKRTNGELNITFRPAGELPFRATEVIKAVGDNQVQLGQAYMGFISGTAPLAGVTGLPYLVRTYEDLDKVYPIIEKAANKEFEKFGVKVLFHFSWPTQNLYGVGKPISNADDFRGRKLRVTDPKQSEMLSRLGAASVTLTTPEVPVALERRTVEGVTTAAFNAIGAKWAELLEWAFFSEINIGGPDYILINKGAYDALPANVRSTLDEVSAEWTKRMISDVSSREKDDRQTLNTKFKIKLITPTQADLNEIVARVQPYWEEWGQQQGPEGVQLIKDIRAKLGK
ncbi:MAG: TRAP transporter substrate-binding protein DctP [Candidatus Lambdaproteobacteria bacterium]|nr:TRAP transporter substrate-binding protein DctP [Candidatus Lambdaproteobacteria bacterium]